MGRFSLGASVACAFLATSAAALAQAPTGPTYGGVGPTVDQEVAGEGVAGEVVTSGSLPFTGFDIAVAVAVGLLLLAVGLMTRRLARTRG